MVGLKEPSSPPLPPWSAHHAKERIPGCWFQPAFPILVKGIRLSVPARVTMVLNGHMIVALNEDHGKGLNAAQAVDLIENVPVDRVALSRKVLIAPNGRLEVSFAEPFVGSVHMIFDAPQHGISMEMDDPLVPGV